MSLKAPNASNQIEIVSINKILITICTCFNRIRDVLPNIVFVISNNQFASIYKQSNLLPCFKRNGICTANLHYLASINILGQEDGVAMNVLCQQDGVDLMDHYHSAFGSAKKSIITTPVLKTKETLTSIPLASPRSVISTSTWHVRSRHHRVDHG